MSDYVLEMKNITKLFPGVKALDNVSFNLKPGEIHALMGENGAGKSTFIKVIAGVHKPEEGEIFLEGEKIEFSNTKEAKEAGVATIYQHSTVYSELTVTENIFMGDEITGGFFNTIQWDTMHEKADALLASLNANFNGRQTMGTLSVAQQQIVEIAKALTQDAKIIIMDEPTASLSNNESEELYELAEKLRDAGKSIIFISHRFEDMYRLASRVTVLRDSQYIGTWDVDEISNEDLIVAMVGREIASMYPERNPTIGEEVLRVDGLSKQGYFKDISFKVRSGEILALTGLVGAGRTEVCEAIYGITDYDEGEILLEGNPFTSHSPSKSLEAGIGLLPEDRQSSGLILEYEIYKNISLSNLRKITNPGWLDESDELAVSDEFSKRLQIKAKDSHVTVDTLSGGNQQKVVFSKILTSFLKVVILDEPTKGVDVGARASIYESIKDMTKNGYAVIMISSEMPEVLGMSDRIMVFKEGRITAELTTSETNQEEILSYSMINKEEMS